MADHSHAEPRTIMLTAAEAAQLAENGEIIAVTHSNGVEGMEVNEDLLQQAFDEASNSFVQENVHFTSSAIHQEDVGNVNNLTVGDTTQFVSLPSSLTVENVNNLQSEQTNFAFVSADASMINAAGVQSVSGSMPETGDLLHHVHVTEQAVVDGVDQIPRTSTVMISANTGTADCPIGSSDNPIRIIQQGNQYTSLQQLTPEHLQQIMQVVQQQQIAQASQKGGGSSILFNPETQTKIVYRVIYPSELHGKNTGQTSSESNNDNQNNSSAKQSSPMVVKVPTSSVMVDMPKRTYKKRLKMEEDDRAEGPELSKEEKEVRKKQRPRTRSGR
jgi:hypothetical protein